MATKKAAEKKELPPVAIGVTVGLAAVLILGAGFMWYSRTTNPAPVDEKSKYEEAKGWYSKYENYDQAQAGGGEQAARQQAGGK